MKKIRLLTILLFSLLIGMIICASISLDEYHFCREILVTDSQDWTKPIECRDETSRFYTTDSAAYLVVKLLDLAPGDEIIYQVKDAEGNLLNLLNNNDPIVVEETMAVRYGFTAVSIASQGLQEGEYFAELFLNGDQVMFDSFTIEEDLSDICEAISPDFHCCQTPLICISAEDGGCEASGGGTCCSSIDDCVPYSENLFSRTEIPSCEDEGLNDCGRVVRLYEYNIHGNINPVQTVAIDYRGLNVDCGDKTDVAIAYYDEETGTWVAKATNVEKLEAENSYRAKALLNYIGYIALIRTDECVPTFCTYAGYRTIPIGAYVTFGETITFEICNMVRGCEATADGICDRQCITGLDPDCGECTSERGDCCLISYDGECDPDCADGVDPDCCDPSLDMCCPGGDDCDPNCPSCSGCTPSGNDCCDPTQDTICDPDCPRLGNEVGYLDPDCCIPYHIPIDSSGGNCCNAISDDVCDPDCIIKTDPDC